MFAAASAEAFTPDVLRCARANPGFVAALEATFDGAIAQRRQRTSLEPMPKAQRAVVHELARHYGMTTMSYGNEPQRRCGAASRPRARSCVQCCMLR